MPFRVFLFSFVTKVENIWGCNSIFMVENIISAVNVLLDTVNVFKFVAVPDLQI